VSTYQTHARIARKIVNHDAHGTALLCMWDDCERAARQLYRFRGCRHPFHWTCRQADAMAAAHGSQGAHIWFAFCSERHAVFFRYSEGWRALAMIDQQGRAYGNLPTGSKGMSR
jgi:hypothetical protein